MSEKPVQFAADKVKTESVATSEQADAGLLDGDLFDKELHEEKSKQLAVSQSSLQLKLESSSKGPAWYFGASFVSLVLVVAGFEAYQLISLLLAINPILGWGAAALSGVTVATGLLAWVKGRIKRKRLVTRKHSRQQLHQLSQQHSFGKAEVLLTELSDEINQEVDISQPLALYQQQKQQSHNDTELIQIYSSQVLSGLDKLALDAISKHASECAAMVALSPLAAADMALVAWRSSKMLQQISRIYGCPQGTFGRLGLTKQVATNLMLAGASELVADAGIELVGKSLTATISGKVAQGIGVGILIARLGTQTMRLCRPVEFTEENKPRLSQLRKLISGKVVAMVSKKDSTKVNKNSKTK